MIPEHAPRRGAGKTLARRHEWPGAGVAPLMGRNKAQVEQIGLVPATGCIALPPPPYALSPAALDSGQRSTIKANPALTGGAAVP
jgi:hypothetical protein